VDLGGNIHQGTIYEATVPAVPVLRSMLDAGAGAAAARVAQGAGAGPARAAVAAVGAA